VLWQVTSLTDWEESRSNSDVPSNVAVVAPNGSARPVFRSVYFLFHLCGSATLNLDIILSTYSTLVESSPSHHIIVIIIIITITIIIITCARA
jgi:hypothetical protein